MYCTDRSRKSRNKAPPVLLYPPTTYRVPIVNSYVSCAALVHLPQRSRGTEPAPAPLATTTIMGERAASIAAAMGPDDEGGWLNVAVNVVDEGGKVWGTEVQRCSRVGFLWIEMWFILLYFFIFGLNGNSRRTHDRKDGWDWRWLVNIK